MYSIYNDQITVITIYSSSQTVIVCFGSTKILSYSYLETYNKPLLNVDTSLYHKILKLLPFSVSWVFLNPITISIPHSRLLEATILFSTSMRSAYIVSTSE